MRLRSQVAFGGPRQMITHPAGVPLRCQFPVRQRTTSSCTSRHSRLRCQALPPPSEPPSSGSPPPTPAHPNRPFMLPMWANKAIQVVGGALLTTGVAFAALPMFLSTGPGLRGAVHVLNRATPGAVEVSEVQLGWLKPVKLQDVQVCDGQEHGGGRLLHVHQASTTATLLQILSGKDYDVVLTQPTIDCSYDKAAGDFKVVRWMEAAGLLSPPPPPANTRATLSTSNADGMSGHTDESSGKVTTVAGESSAAAAATQLPSPATLPKARAVKGKAAVQAATEAASTSEGSRVLSMLARADSIMGFTADFRTARAQVHVADGTLQVPVEVRDMLGPHVHVTGAVGRQQLHELAEELALDASWMDQPSPEGREGTESLPPGREDPFIVHVDAAHLRAEMRGWEGRGRGAPTRLHSPAKARLDFTPGLARFGLAAANPLLSDVLDVQGGGQVSLSFAPERLQLPYSTATISAAPMQLRLGAGSTLAQVLRLLDLGPGSGSVTGDALLSAWDVTYTRGGLAETRRVDMSVGVGTHQVHLVLWGCVDLATDQVCMQVGLPASSLALLGLRDVPPEYILPIALRGTTDRPSLGLAEAGGKLAQLALRQRLLDLKRRAASTQQPRSSRRKVQAPAAAAGRAAITAADQQAAPAATGAQAASAGTAKDQRGGKPGGCGCGWLSAVVQAMGPSDTAIKRVDDMIAADLQSVPPLRQPLPWLGERPSAPI